MPHEVLEMTHKFMNEPFRVLVKRDELTLEGIKQFFVAVEREQWKFGKLLEVHALELLPFQVCTIHASFCPSGLVQMHAQFAHPLDPCLLLPSENEVLQNAKLGVVQK